MGSSTSIPKLAAGGPPARWAAALSLFCVGALALVGEPLLWLWRTWSDPSYESDGQIVALAVLAMAGWSLLSGPAPPDPRARRWAWRLFALTAGLRLLGRLLAVNTIGALALVVDVAALGLLLGVARRPFALGPFCLAAFSLMALPVEHLWQRLLAHPLQWLSAVTSEQVLAPFFPLLERQGTLLWHPDAPLAIDLPCSGARGIVLLASVALAISCRRRVNGPRLAAGAAAVLAGALLANTLRIVWLFVGTVAGWPVLDEPWHTVLGTAALVVGLMPVLGVAAGSAPRTPSPQRLPAAAGARLASPRLASSFAVFAAGVAVAVAPEHPVDVSPRGLANALPLQAGDFHSEPAALLPTELRYYARYGGSVEKRTYDDRRGPVHTALLVHTRSPLRHLHGPDRCLIGAGHVVTRMGVRPGAVPTVVYRSEAPDGVAWRVEASFVSDAGDSASSVSQVVWRWLESPQTGWKLVERISPWSVCEADPARCAALDASLFAALDLPSAPASLAALSRTNH